eukprot:3988233-Amphidinium_carterae.1
MALHLGPFGFWVKGWKLVARGANSKQPDFAVLRAQTDQRMPSAMAGSRFNTRASKTYNFGGRIGGWAFGERLHATLSGVFQSIL